MNKLIYLLLFMLLPDSSAISQIAAGEHTAPFSGVKWLQNNPYVLIEGEWYLLVSLQGTEANKIVAFCKKEYKEKWQDRFSTNIDDVMIKMGKPLSQTAEMRLIKDGKTVTRKEEMTKDKRKAARQYNRDNAGSGKATSQKEIVDKTQKDISEFANTTLDKPFLCKSAKIEFNVTGHKLFAGKETMYIDDYGKTVIVIVDRPGVMNNPVHNTTIWKDKKTIVLDHSKKTYYSTPIRPKSTEPPVISYSNETQRQQGGYEKKGTETVAGKSCDVYEHKKMKVTYWLWKNVDVKLINYAMGGSTGYTKEATSIQENITIPAEFFKIPDGYNKQ